VKSLNGLYLTSFDASRIRISSKVKKFYEDLVLDESIQRKEPEKAEPQSQPKLENDTRIIELELESENYSD